MGSEEYELMILQYSTAQATVMLVYDGTFGCNFKTNRDDDDDDKHFP